MASKQKVLVIANRTADSPELIAVLRRLGEEGAGVTLLVPAVPHGLSWAADMKAGWSAAISCAEAASQRMRTDRVVLDEVVVGDPDPFAAAGDVLHGGDFSAVVVSTLPRSVSKWLRLSLADRIRRAFEIPVTQVSTHPRARSGPVRRRKPVPVSP